MSTFLDFDQDSEEMGTLGGMPTPSNLPSIHELELRPSRLKMRYADYKISSTYKTMTPTECIGISTLGIQFFGPTAVTVGSLVRVWIEMPDYWKHKSKHVAFRHTDAPSYFQILSRVIQVNEYSEGNERYVLVVQNLNLDPIDELILKEYINSNSSGKLK